MAFFLIHLLKSIKPTKMKIKTITAFLAGMALVSTLAFKAPLYDLKNSSAEVEQLEGLFVFTDAKPIKEFDYLGSEKVTISLGSGSYQDIRDKLIKKVKKEYPTANGIVFHFKDGSADKADAIKIK